MNPQIALDASLLCSQGPPGHQTLTFGVELIEVGPSLEQMTGGLCWCQPDEDTVEPLVNGMAPVCQFYLRRAQRIKGYVVGAPQTLKSEHR